MTCTNTIKYVVENGTFDTVPKLDFNVITPFNITILESKLFLIKLPIYQKVEFQTIVTSGRASFSIEIYDDKGIKLATANITNYISSFSINLERGTYFVCLSTNTSYVTGTITAIATEYAEIITFSSKFYFGSQLKSELYIKPPDIIDCNETVYFELVDGALPEGTIINKLGRISGYLPNMDCTEDNLHLSPSNNWMFQDGSMWYPWGRQYKFCLKAYIDSGPNGLGTAEPIEQWFCIRIYNNWDFDRNNFLSQMPFKRLVTREITEEVDPLPHSVCIQKCEPPYVLPFVPQAIKPITENKSLCDSCDGDVPNIIFETIKIPQTINCGIAEINQLDIWWKKINENTNQSPEVLKFINSLKQSDIFKSILLKESNVEISVIGSSLELVRIEYNEDNNITTISEENRIAQNNKNDMYYRLSFGSYLSYTLD